VSLQQSKTDERGLAVHGRCYLLKLRRKSKSSEEVGARKRRVAADWVQRLWIQCDGHNIAEYTLIFAVIVMVVVSTIRLLGSH
jgi:Flp pilus assembly pilin Flp